MPKPELKPQIDVTNTEIAFSNKSNSELNNTYRLFKLMSNSLLVNCGSKLGLIAIKARLPFVKTIVKKTIFKQFCGGESLLDCQDDIDTLNKYDSLTILDYGAEAKSDKEDLDKVRDEIVRAVEFAASNTSVPVVVAKVSGLADNDLLENKQQNESLTDSESRDYELLVERLDAICSRAEELGVGVFLDAEESWVQDTIDQLADEMMAKHNRKKVIVYNTFQLYRHDRLAFLKASHKKALDGDYLLGAKIVRGAYMQKEALRAAEIGYVSPIQKDKESTDRDFNEAVIHCVKNYETIGSCCATHNIESSLLQAELIHELGIRKNHPHLNFCQLYGMSDYITFNIGDAGFNVAKYLPYGPIREVIPYLIRRAQENTSITGEMGRELQFLQNEMERRKLS